MVSDTDGTECDGQGNAHIKGQVSNERGILSLTMWLIKGESEEALKLLTSKPSRRGGLDINKDLFMRFSQVSVKNILPRNLVPWKCLDVSRLQ